MGVAGRRLDLAVPQQLPDHRQALAERQSARREAVAEVMEPHILKPGPSPNAIPVVGDLRHVPAGPAAGNDPGIAGHSRQSGENPRRGRRQRHYPWARLAVAEPEFAGFQMHVVPTQGQDLAAPASGKHQQAQRRRRMRRHPALGLQRGQLPPEAAELLLRQEPLELAPLVLDHEAAGIAALQAQEPQREIPAETLIEAARAALTAGALDDAELLLDGVEPSAEHIDDLDFLYGTIALARGDWEAAIARFRAMLARDPTLVRVRLDLALAYFQARQDGNAASHFRQALGAPDLPPAARDNALRFLDEIRRRRTWSVSTQVALAPDNNINAATRARIVELFGLPAELSEDARQTSGVGLSVNVTGTHEAGISPDLRFRTSANVSTRTYRKRQFNNRTLTVRAGPRFLFERFDLRPALTLRARRLGGELYVRAGGLEVSGDWQVAPEWRLSGTVSAERLFYEPGFPSCSPFDDRAADEAIIKRRFARAACRMVRTGDGKRASGRAGSRGA